VLACPPASCLPRGCPGHEFRKKGIQGCGIDTSAPVGSVFSLTFVVLDRWLPPAMATTERVITIRGPCPAAAHFCNGACYKVLVPVTDAHAGGFTD
jgi:hypothetical protein